MKKTVIALPPILAILAFLGCGGNSPKDTAQKLENSPPARVLVAEPADGSFTPAGQTDLSVKFSTAVDPSSFGPGSFIVKDGEGRVVDGTVSQHGKKATFTPIGDLGADQTYTFSLAVSVRDQQGRAFAPFTSTIKTNPALIVAPVVAVSPYGMLDNTQPGGPVYAYDDISSTGTELTDLTGQDDEYQTVPLPFPIFFYGIQHNTMDVSTNGNINFNSDSRYSNKIFPRNDGTQRIAPFWDDLYLTTNNAARIYYQVKGTSPNRRVIVQWFDVPHIDWDDATPAPAVHLDFQVIMYENSTNILFQYRKPGFWSDATINAGASATVGLNLGDGINSSQYSYNTPTLAAGRAILFSNYNMIFTDYSGGSRLKINSTTGAYVWEFLSGGVVVNSYSGTGAITITPTSIYLTDGTTLTLSSSRTRSFSRATYVAPGGVYTLVDVVSRY